MLSFKVYFFVSLIAAGLLMLRSVASANEVCHCDLQCCPMGWLGYEGHCYRYFTERKNFTDARNYCQGLNADLVSIHSSIENGIVNGLSSGEEVGSLSRTRVKLQILCQATHLKIRGQLCTD